MFNSVIFDVILGLVFIIICMKTMVIYDRAKEYMADFCNAADNLPV
jgi:hypothetical protein